MPILQTALAQMPEVTETGTPCADGYEWVDGQCLLTSRRGEDRCCWTTIVNVPKCVGPCKVGKVLNPATGICEEPKKESGGGGCGACKQISCCSGGCYWDTGLNKCVSTGD